MILLSFFMHNALQFTPPIKNSQQEAVFEKKT
jgi:hypothetical protein